MPDSPNGAEAVEFPRRDETFLFRQLLETSYRDTLRRSSSTSFVDIEGSIVWTQEYLRYRVNGCGHQEGIIRVTAQIQGRGIQPVCADFTGTSVTFPPRNEPFDFRQELERLYRDELRRGPVQTFVDAEGDIVWTQEYLRYRLNGCGHQDAVDRVLAQVAGGPVQPTCTGSTPPPPSSIGGFVSVVTAPGATTTLVNSPRPNAGAGPIVTPLASSGSQIVLSASSPVDRIIVSVNTIGSASTRLSPLAVLTGFYDVRLPSPQTSIVLTVQAAGSFNFEIAGSLGNGPLGSYQSRPFPDGLQPLSFTFTPNPVPFAGFISGVCAASTVRANTWLYSLRITNTTSTPFVISSASFTLRATGASNSFAFEVSQLLVSLAFGSFIVPPNGSLTGSLCTTLADPSGSVFYTFRSADGRGPFSTPELRLLP